MVGRLEKGLDGRRESGHKKRERQLLLVVGVQGASSQHSHLEQTNGCETDSVVSNRREARCALDISLHLSFSKCCFVCSPLNKPPVPQKRNHALFAAVHNYQPFKTGLFATLNDVVNLCTNTRQAIFCCKSFSQHTS